MATYRCLLFFLSFLYFSCVSCQSQAEDRYKIMFYNVENLFDTIDNPSTNDEEFLTGGHKSWNSYKYWSKINKLYQVIVSAGEDSPPDIIGLCEIESFLPLYNLCFNTPLSRFPYTIIHKESPDWRGIDVALLVRKDRVKVLKKDFLRVQFPRDTSTTTREILYSSLLIDADTLHAFVNHWPSRWGGQEKSEPRRMAAAQILVNAIDTLCASIPNAKIIVMGDFNDEPHDKSLALVEEETGLRNISKSLQETCKCGSYKYKSEWNMIDQFLVSISLYSKEKLSIAETGMNILDADFLLESDKTYGGFKPYRTYLGPRYIGGYSDHLPILIELQYVRKP